MTVDRSFPLEALAALGGRPMSERAAQSAIAARVSATDGLAAMRAVSLPLIDAIEPGHHAARLRDAAATALRAEVSASGRAER